MKLIVLGASNEIRKNGYVRELKGKWQVSNLAIGGCGTTAGIYNLLRHQSERASFAVLSYEVNEQIAVDHGIRTLAEVRETWEWLIFRLREIGTLPVILTLPRMGNGTFVNTSIRNLKRDLAQELQVPLIDFTGAFSAAERQGCSPSRLMLDNAHPNDDVCRVIGPLVAQLLSRLYRTATSHKEFSYTLRDFRLVSLPEASNRGSILRKNSFTGAQYIAIQAPTPLSINIAESECIWSISVNRGAPGGKISLSSRDRSLVKNLSFAKNHDEVGKFAKIVSDFKTRIEGPEAVLRVEPREASVTEETVQSQPPLTSSDYGEIEADTLLIASRTTQSVTRTHRVINHPFNLITRELEDNLVRDLLQITTSSSSALTS